MLGKKPVITVIEEVLSSRRKPRGKGGGLTDEKGQGHGRRELYRGIQQKENPNPFRERIRTQN